jgi:hypothetical protein
MRCSSRCALGAEPLAKRAAPMLVARSIARNHNMSALEQLPFESAQPVQVEIVTHDSPLEALTMCSPNHSLQEIRGDHNRGRTVKR